MKRSDREDEGERKRLREKETGKRELEKVNVKGMEKGNGERESEVQKEEKKGEWKGKDKDVARGKRKGR